MIALQKSFAAIASTKMNSEQQSLISRIGGLNEANSDWSASDDEILAPPSSPADDNKEDRLASCRRGFRNWLMTNARANVGTGTHWFTEEDENCYRPAPLFRRFIFNPVQPEFIETHWIFWVPVIGVATGFLAWLWGQLIEVLLEFIWKTLPQFLYHVGLFTGPDGRFPLYHYIWITLTIFGGVLGFRGAHSEAPDQNAFIKGIHTRGGTDSKTCLNLFLDTTSAVSSGLSLGPELPLVLFGGMLGSFVGRLCRQSIIQTRVMSLAAASSAVAAFFGLPMVGALFVLEIPHRNGLEYIEALSPSVCASIVAVGVRSALNGEDFMGKFVYPLLPDALPPCAFGETAILAVIAWGIGSVYFVGVKFLKAFLHDWFHADNQDEGLSKTLKEEEIIRKGSLEPNSSWPLPSLHIRRKGLRGAVLGALASALVGIICIFVPHVMFWGEAQLQTVIDRGHTPLPFFSKTDGPTSVFTAHAFCMVDSSEESAGFGPGCAALIAGSKIVVTGLSLGTGILGGHFWGPLFVGCASSHIIMDLAKHLSWTRFLIKYPELVSLCLMAGTHVVVFRAWFAIPFVILLTTKSGSTSSLGMLGFVGVNITRILSRKLVFYKAQRSRHDLVVVPEALCEPGKKGRPLVPAYQFSERTAEEDRDIESCRLIPSSRTARARTSSRSTVSSHQSSLVHVEAFGEVKEDIPCVVTQARLLAASSFHDGYDSEAFV